MSQTASLWISEASLLFTAAELPAEKGNSSENVCFFKNEEYFVIRCACWFDPQPAVHRPAQPRLTAALQPENTNHKIITAGRYVTGLMKRAVSLRAQSIQGQKVMKEKKKWFF